MSNIYIQEPPTNGKVLLKTTVGDIDIELWSKEAPLACRNFVQLCMEGYYNNVIFHRLVKGFIVQGGDPSGTGLGGESIYGQPFKDEFHSRLRFMRRGLIALANGGTKDDNGSQFFFTLGMCPDLQNKHTIFGKVTGQTLFNLLRLADSDVDQNERPIYPQKIISTEILNNPFSDIVPRSKPQKKVGKSREETARSNVKASKNFSLLSFGDEAEVEEEEINKVSNEFRGKSKSSHDLLKNDSKLSAIPVVDRSELSEDIQIIKKEVNSDSENDDKIKKQRINKVKDKLNAKQTTSNKIKNEIEDDADIDIIDLFECEKMQKKNKEIEKAKEEFSKIKKQFLKELVRKNENETMKKLPTNSAVAEFAEETNKFREASGKIAKKGKGREEQCWDALQKFKDRLQVSKKHSTNNEKEETLNSKTAWLNHKMNCTGEDEIVLARDANIRKEEDWYNIYDPRNPINKRRREG
ncbi:hypothetical protein RDWZM_003538 [Blomia tropicalis]|uniref:Spliceosome-associated protein CWC27 homolog n=1 Tax=Blomia tropicalis TaxID=40697 RepID=A0A9Q0RQZ1_BLOTA|nr:hypothetical protein RDWZM_003538 [Blomia tropicalis]